MRRNSIYQITIIISIIFIYFLKQLMEMNFPTGYFPISQTYELFSSYPAIIFRSTFDYLMYMNLVLVSTY